jgi:hypothetical protein
MMSQPCSCDIIGDSVFVTVMSLVPFKLALQLKDNLHIWLVQSDFCWPMRFHFKILTGNNSKRTVRASKRDEMIA